MLGMSLASLGPTLRAALEAIALRIVDVFMAMERDLDARFATLSVDGGPPHNDLLIQLQANLLGRPVKRLNVQELSAFGAAVLAGAAAGLIDETKVVADLTQ